MAVAQALLGWPGLLVLDEPWTGLDQGARATLDGAVAERLAEEATVVFVDHDPARLAGQARVHWALSGGRLAVSPAPGSSSGNPGDSGDADDLAEADDLAGDVGELLIEVDGYAGGPAALLGLGGVLAAGPDERGGLRVRVRASHSDDLLRHIPTSDQGMHVRRVGRPGRGLGPGDRP